MKPGLCLFTDSSEPSGMGELMLTLAAELRGRYRLSFICPPTQAGCLLLRRATALGVEVLALDMAGQASRDDVLGDWIRHHRIGIFHDHAGIGWEGHSGVYTARDAGVPAVLRTEHLPYLLTDAREQEAHRQLVHVIDRLICVSEGARASFLAAGVPPHKLGVVRNGIRPNRIAPDRPGIRARLGLSPADRIVLTVGRFTEQKGHRLLVEAMPAILEAGEDIHFVWVGRGPLEHELRRLVRRRGLGGWVHFVGQRSDVLELMAAADVFVLPSSFEGLPLVVLEAMAAGLPVVGTFVCGIAEAVEDERTGRLVERDSSQLARGVLDILNDPQQAARLGAAGRQRVLQEFSAARMARDMMAIYREMVKAL
jgi:glycosyltransferase involved in cell wall biosynthesis